MSVKAEQFILKYTKQYVAPLWYGFHKEQAKYLAWQCMNFAEESGITKRELEDVVGRLDRYFEDALEVAQDAQVKLLDKQRATSEP